MKKHEIYEEKGLIKRRFFINIRKTGLIMKCGSGVGSPVCIFGMAIRNMIKVRKEKSLLLVTLRNISYADALVSLLSLQTALFAAFGQDSGELIPLMNALTSAGVCLMILGIGIYMVRKSKKIQISASIVF